MKSPRILSAGIAIVIFPAIAPAIDFNWLGSGDPTNWSDPLNWDGNGVPISGGGSNIYVHTANNANILGVALDAGNFYLATGNAAAPTSGYTFGQGVYNIANLYVGEGFNGTPIANAYGNAFITSGTTINASHFHLGERSGASGHVVQSGGDVNISTQFRLSHWPQGGATNSYDLNGGTFNITGPAGNPLDEGAGGTVILGIDSVGTFTVNGGTMTAHGITMQTRPDRAGEATFVVNGGIVNIGVNGFVTNQPGNLGSYDIRLGGGTVRATSGWTSNLEMHLNSGGTGVHLDTNGNNVTLSGALNGAGGLTKDGNGKLILSNPNNSYTGPTIVTGGTLQIDTTGTAPGSDITLQSGSSFQVDVAGKTLQALSVAAGTTLSLPALIGGTTTITNVLNFTGTPNFTIKPGLFAAPAVNDTFDLLTAGSIIGPVGAIITDFGLSHASGHTSLVGNKLVLTIDTAGGILTWSNGAGTGIWATNADVNFTGADGKFLNNDQVTFGNTAAGTVTLVGTLLPSAVFVNSTANYTFTGAGSIGGVGALSKAGSGTLTISTLNSYSGGTNVTAGVLELTAQSAGTGAIRGNVTVGPGAELRATGNSGAIFGYTTGEKIDILNINGGLVNSVGGDNHLWNATVNMTGGELRVNDGVSSPFGFTYQWGNTVLNTLASNNSAVITGSIRIRADGSPNMAMNVADGAADTDLLVSAAVTEGNGATNITKNGAGHVEFSGGVAVTGTIRPNEGIMTLSGVSPFSAGQMLVTGGATVNLANGASLSVNTLAFGVGAQNETVGGTMNLSAGTTVNVATAFRAGDSNGGGSLTQGIINQTGGAMNVNVPNTDGRNFVLGHWAATSGEYNLSGGTLNSQGISVAVSWDGTGTFALSGGVANVKGLVFGNTYNPGSTGIFNLTGGELNLGDEGIRAQVANKNTDINLGGGTIRATTNTLIAVPAELTGTNGNPVFDTNGNTIGVTGAMTGTGGFTKTGNGRMILDAPNSAAGPFTVNGGTLSAQGFQAANRIPANATVQVNNSGTFEFGSTNATDFNASYIVGAGGTLTNAAGVDHAHVGSVQLTGGTWTTDAGAIAYNGENYQLHGNVTVTGPTPSLITQVGGTAANRGISWDGSATFSVAGGSLLTVSTELENADIGSASLVKSGGGTMHLTFASSFSGGTTVNDGTLRVSGLLTATNQLNLIAGSFLLGASDLINDAAALNLAGGEFNTGGFSEGNALAIGLGLFSLSANSILDFGPGSASSLLFAGLGSHTPGAVLSILNWTQGGSNDRLMFAGDNAARLAFESAFTQSDISFNGTSGYAAVQLDASHFEVVAVPEPSSTVCIAASALLGLAGFRRRHPAPTSE